MSVPIDTSLKPHTNHPGHTDHPHTGHHLSIHVKVAKHKPDTGTDGRAGLDLARGLFPTDEALLEVWGVLQE